jgi:hypothetical protein
MTNLWNKLMILNKVLKMKEEKENKKKKSLLLFYNQSKLKLENNYSDVEQIGYNFE